MKLGRCPVCHSHLHLDAIVQDDAGRELIAILAGLPANLGRALVAYLGLFRAPNRDLANARALKLVHSALELTSNHDHLAHAMSETAETIRAKGGKALKNHNYLKTVLEGTTPPTTETRPVATTEKTHTKPHGKTMQALMALEQMKGEPCE